MKVSYVNLGTRVEDGEVKANLPKNNTPAKVVDLKDIWMRQANMNPNNEKGMDGMIFPLDVEKLFAIDTMKENAIEGNGLIFLDIDINDSKVKDKIFDEIDSINAEMRGYIQCAAKTKNGLHIICLGNPMVAEVYKETACDALVFFAKKVLELLNIDLRNYEGALDTHNCCMKQRFFLRYSPKIYWFDYCVPMVIRYSVKQRMEMVKEYPAVYKIITHKPRHKGYAVQRKGCVIEGGMLNGKVDYIGHSLRWSLFDSLCLCSDDEKGAMEGWKKCVEHMPYEKHSKAFLLNEPIKNHWYRRLQENIEAGQDAMINYKLMEMFDYYVVDENSKVIMFNESLKNNNI